MASRLLCRRGCGSRFIGRDHDKLHQETGSTESPSPAFRIGRNSGFYFAVQPNARGERRPTHKHIWREKKACRVGCPLHYDVRRGSLPGPWLLRLRRPPQGLAAGFPAGGYSGLTATLRNLITPAPCCSVNGPSANRPLWSSAVFWPLRITVICRPLAVIS